MHLTQEEINWALNKDTLRHQARGSMKFRAEAFERQFDKEIRTSQIRGLYKGAMVTKQKIKSRLGAPILEHEDIQAMKIADL